MKPTVRLLLCMALAGLIRGGALADVTDARLAQKVTYEARHQSVKKILEELSAQTGIKLKAGLTSTDWPVRSRRMNIFVKDATMASLMNSIAHVMKFRWSCNDAVDPPVYRLAADPKAVLAAEALEENARKKREETWRTRREWWIDAIMKYGSMSPEEMEPLRQRDQIVYEFGRRGALRAIKSLFEEVPETRKRYAEGKSFRISVCELSRETGLLCYSAGNEFSRYLQMRDGKEGAGYGDVLKADEDFDVVLSRPETQGFTPNLRWGSSGWGMTGYFELFKGAKNFELANLSSPDSYLDQFRSIAHNKVLDGIASDEAWDGADAARSKEVKRREQEEASFYPDEPLNKHTGFLELHKAIKLNVDIPKEEQAGVTAASSYIWHFEKALADAVGLGVVSDSWVSIKCQRLPEDKEWTAGELLDTFAQDFGYNWDRPSRILEFRYRKAWRNRLNQVPEEWVSTWSRNTEKNRILSLDDLASISNLTYEQAEESVKPDKVIGEGGIYDQILSMLDTNGNLHWLRLYSTLSPQLKALLTSERGINGQMLTSAQWNLTQIFFDRLSRMRGDAVFRLASETNNKRISYDFTEIDPDTGEIDRVWSVRIPRLAPLLGGEK